ncbi:MAG: hypothetical protein ACYC9Y_11945 [Candidatus Methylomirabilia bacterium]
MNRTDHRNTLLKLVVLKEPHPFDMASAYGGVTKWDGRGIDENTMTGTRKIVGGRCEFEANWTAIMISR